MNNVIKSVFVNCWRIVENMVKISVFVNSWRATEDTVEISVIYSIDSQFSLPRIYDIPSGISLVLLMQARLFQVVIFNENYFQFHSL